MEALSKWINSLSYGYVLGGLAVLMIGFYFIFNAIPRTKPVKAQLLCVVGMDLITLLFYILTFSLRVSKMAAQSGATPRTMPRLWAFLMIFASIGAYIAEQRALYRNGDDRHGRKEQAAADPDACPLVCVYVFCIQ